MFCEKFGSLRCCELRPGGFRKDDPPHLCERLTCETIEFAYEYVKTVAKWLTEEQAAHIKGWDFSHIDGKYDEDQDLPCAEAGRDIHYSAGQCEK